MIFGLKNVIVSAVFYIQDTWDCLHRLRDCGVRI